MIRRDWGKLGAYLFKTWKDEEEIQLRGFGKIYFIRERSLPPPRLAENGQLQNNCRLQSSNSPARSMSDVPDFVLCTTLLEDSASQMPAVVAVGHNGSGLNGVSQTLP